MSIDTTIFGPLAPIGLAKANIELSLRTGRLLQEYAQQWLELASRAGKDELAESDAELSDVIAAPDWQSLAALPVESFWRQVQQRYGDLEAAAQIAVGAQTTLAHGLQAALNEWQKAAASVLGCGFPLQPPVLAQPFDDILKQWAAGFVTLLQETVVPAAKTAPAPAKAAPKSATKSAKPKGTASDQ